MSDLKVGDWVKSHSDKILFVGQIKNMHEVPQEGDTSSEPTYIVTVAYSGFYEELVWLSGELEKITEAEAMLCILQGANSE